MNASPGHMNSIIGASYTNVLVREQKEAMRLASKSRDAGSELNRGGGEGRGASRAGSAAWRDKIISRFTDRRPQEAARDTIES